MEALIRIIGLCLVTSVVAVLLRRSSPEISLLLTIAAVLVGGALLLSAVSGIAALGDELVGLTGLAPVLFTPLLKVTAIALVSRIGSAFCADAGQNALSRVMEAAGAVCALACALPLVEAVIDLIRLWI